MSKHYEPIRTVSSQFARILSMFAGLYCLCSCVNTKQLVYFQDLTNRPDSTLLKPFTSVIQPGDLLSIPITSLNAEATAFFNPYATPINAQPGLSTPTTPLPVATGYSVAADSTITLPMIGRVVVAGQTNSSAAERIRQKLKPYLKEATVTVRNLNFRITVLGEVNHPSLFSIPNERITLPEALGLAGDLTIYGRRENILIIREENGQRNYTRLDLTKRDVFRSPYYYLHPNDVVYVEPGTSRAAAADRFYQIVPIVLSTLSVIALVVTNVILRN